MHSTTTRAWRVLAVLVVVSGLPLACRKGATQDHATTDGARAPLDKILAEPAHYSQHREEPIIRHFFRDRRNGFFVDVGCGFARADSNTYYLEEQLGWTGIAVDALAEYGPSWREKRPGSKFFNYFVSDHSDGPQEFYRSDLRGTSSYLKENVERRARKGAKVAYTEIQVPTITLTKLLADNDVSKIDLLSMDIEGAEPIALAGFDMQRFKPALVCVEAKPEIREKLKEYLDGHGYVRLDQYLQYDTVNYYYAPREAPSPQK